MKAFAVTLVDAGTGNLRSVYHALLRVGAEVTLTADPGTVRRGGRVILPGVGAFGRFMDGLRGPADPPCLPSREALARSGLAEAVAAVYRRGDPLLGICVGMQALFEVGEELGQHVGLGFLPGRVVRFPDQVGLKAPQTGWNQIWPRRASPLLDGLNAGAYAYFNHSYYCAAGDPGDILAVTDYGLEYASVVQKGSLYGVQFHPEKSQAVGLRLLENFVCRC